MLLVAGVRCHTSQFSHLLSSRFGSLRRIKPRTVILPPLSEQMHIFGTSLLYSLIPQNVTNMMANMWKRFRTKCFAIILLSLPPIRTITNRENGEKFLQHFNILLHTLFDAAAGRHNRSS